MTISFQFLQGLERDHGFQLFLCHYSSHEFVYDSSFPHIFRIPHHYSVFCLNDRWNIHGFYDFLSSEKLAPYCLSDVLQFYVVLYQAHQSIMKTFPYIFVPTNCNFKNRTIKRFVNYSIYITHISLCTSSTPAKYCNVTFSFTITSCTNRNKIIFGMIDLSTLFTRSFLFSLLKICSFIGRTCSLHCLIIFQII